MEQAHLLEMAEQRDLTGQIPYLAPLHQQAVAAALLHNRAGQLLEVAVLAVVVQITIPEEPEILQAPHHLKAITAVLEMEARQIMGLAAAAAHLP